MTSENIFSLMTEHENQPDRKPMTYFVVNDNRGKNPNMLPHEAFSVVKMIGKQVMWEEHHYSQDEAQRAAELHTSKKS
jgi:hypothetical protein